MINFTSKLLVAAWVLLVTGCMGFNPATDMLRNEFGLNEKRLTAGYEYLEVELEGRLVALALGYREQVGADVHEYWYSGQKEMLHLVNGRVAEAMGMTQELRGVGGLPPEWAQMLQSKKPLNWSRSKDLMPGYRYGVKEFISSEHVQPNRAEMKLMLGDVVWIQEEVVSKEANGNDWHYKERFAVRGVQVVYSFQCISSNLCLKLRPIGTVTQQ